MLLVNKPSRKLSGTANWPKKRPKSANHTCWRIFVAFGKVSNKIVETIEAEGPTGNTVILLGKVIDSETREEVPIAQVLIESDRGAMRFNSPFVFSFPSMSVITLTVAAPGYEVRQEVMKPHYRRDVTLTMDIPLVPIPARKD